MGKIINGYIFDELDKEYTFTYDGELLQLVPSHKEEIKPYDFLNNILVEKELLKGTTTQNRNIFFLKCRLQRNNSGYIAKPIGYICFDGENSTYRTIVFKGEAVNFFYRPNQILDEASEYPWDNDGGGKLIIKKFSEITRQKEVWLAGEKCNFVVSITRPEFPEQMTCCYSLGQPHSFIRLEFQKDVPVEKFAEVYMTIHHLLEFVFFKKDIYVEHIELGVFNEEQKIHRNAEVHLLHKKDLELENPNSVIGYYFIEDGLNELLQILNGKKLNFLFIPENEKDDRYLDPQKYVTCCSSFESVFNFAFPDAKTMENNKMKEAKASILNFIADKDEEFKGNDGAIRKEYRSLKRIIELADFSLADKYKWCLKKYWSYIEEFCKIVYQKMNLTEEQIKDIPERLAFKRNVLIHSNIEELELEEIAAYQILRYMIYVIILDKCGINQNTVKNAIDCILR